jgi:hypothetical protein
MKIGFDMSILVYQGSGVVTYMYNLVKHEYTCKDMTKKFYILLDSLQ